MSVGAPPVGFVQKGDLLIPKADLLTPLGFGAPPGLSDPTELSGLVGWWKADAITATDGDAITTWPDSSAAAHDVTAPAGAEPTYKASAKNGLPALLFDETNDDHFGFDNSAWSALAESGDPGWTAFAVFRPAAGSLAATRNILGVRGEWEGFKIEDHGGGTGAGEIASVGAWDVAASTEKGSDNHSADAWYIAVGRNVGATSCTIRINGAEYNSITHGITSADGQYGFGIGMREDQVGTSFDGHIGECGVYNVDHPDGSLSDLMGYLNDRWAVY